MDGSHSLNRRFDERVETDIALTCRIPATPVRGRILDLSHSGCRLVLDTAHPEDGATVSIDAAGRHMTGEIVWHQGKEVGIRFHRKLAPDLAVHWGISAPEPVEVAVEVLPEENRGVGEMISHWFRRLGSVFS